MVNSGVQQHHHLPPRNGRPGHQYPTPANTNHTEGSLVRPAPTFQQPFSNTGSNSSNKQPLAGAGPKHPNHVPQSQRSLNGVGNSQFNPNTQSNPNGHPGNHNGTSYNGRGFNGSNGNNSSAGNGGGNNGNNNGNNDQGLHNHGPGPVRRGGFRGHHDQRPYRREEQHHGPGRSSDRQHLHMREQGQGHSSFQPPSFPRRGPNPSNPGQFNRGSDNRQQAPSQLPYHHPDGPSSTRREGPPFRGPLEAQSNHRFPARPSSANGPNGGPAEAKNIFENANGMHWDQGSAAIPSGSKQQQQQQQRVSHQNSPGPQWQPPHAPSGPARPAGERPQERHGRNGNGDHHLGNQPGMNHQPGPVPTNTEHSRHTKNEWGNNRGGAMSGGANKSREWQNERGNQRPMHHNNNQGYEDRNKPNRSVDAGRASGKGEKFAHQNHRASNNSRGSWKHVNQADPQQNESNSQWVPSRPSSSSAPVTSSPALPQPPLSAHIQQAEPAHKARPGNFQAYPASYPAHTAGYQSYDPSYGSYAAGGPNTAAYGPGMTGENPAQHGAGPAYFPPTAEYATTAAPFSHHGPGYDPNYTAYQTHGSRPYGTETSAQAGPGYQAPHSSGYSTPSVPTEGAPMVQGYQTGQQHYPYGHDYYTGNSAYPPAEGAHHGYAAPGAGQMPEVAAGYYQSVPGSGYDAYAATHR